MQFKPGDIVLHQGLRWKVGVNPDTGTVDRNRVWITCLDDSHLFEKDRYYWTTSGVIMIKSASLKKSHLPSWL